MHLESSLTCTRNLHSVFNYFNIIQWVTGECPNRSGSSMQTMGEQENLQQPKQRQPNETQQPLSNCFFFKSFLPYTLWLPKNCWLMSRPVWHYYLQCLFYASLFLHVDVRADYILYVPEYAGSPLIWAFSLFHMSELEGHCTTRKKKLAGGMHFFKTLFWQNNSLLKLKGAMYIIL